MGVGNVDMSLLKENAIAGMSEYRAAHTLGVVDAVSELAGLYSPLNKEKLVAAALLHDITKELSYSEHMRIFAEHNVAVDDLTASMPKVLHAETAALVIPERFPEHSDKIIISAVKNHTVGSQNMSLEDMLLYLADYIEAGRRFDSCKRLRESFFAANPENMCMDERLEHLRAILLISLDMTISELLNDKAPIHPNTVAFRNELMLNGIKITGEI